MKFVNENNGYFPVRIESLPEGTVANVHVPVYQIFAEKEYTRLVTFLETILTQVRVIICGICHHIVLKFHHVTSCRHVMPCHNG